MGCQALFLPAVSRVNTRYQGEELICGRGLGTWWTQSRAGRQDLCFPKHHLTFFKVTNSFSAQGRSESSSSYLEEGSTLLWLRPLRGEGLWPCLWADTAALSGDRHSSPEHLIVTCQPSLSHCQSPQTPWGPQGCFTLLLWRKSPYLTISSGMGERSRHWRGIFLQLLGGGCCSREIPS